MIILDIVVYGVFILYCAALVGRPLAPVDLDSDAHEDNDQEI